MFTAKSRGQQSEVQALYSLKSKPCNLHTVSEQVCLLSMVSQLIKNEHQTLYYRSWKCGCD